MANGATWFVATRLRHSIRRSLPATSAASRNMKDALFLSRFALASLTPDIRGG